MGRSIPEAPFDAMPFTGSDSSIAAQGDALHLPQVPAVFALGNGFIGICGPGGGTAAARVYLNGVYEQVAIPYHEAAFGYAAQSDTRLGVADATQPIILIDGEPIGAPHHIVLDMQTGLRTDHYRHRGVAFEITTIVSMTRAAIVAQRICFASVDAPRVAISALVTPPPVSDAPAAEDGVYDPRTAPQLAHNPWRAVSDETKPDGLLAMRVDRLPVSGYSVAAVCAVAPPLVAGDHVTIDIVSAYAASRTDDCLAVSLAALADARTAGVERLFEEQRNWYRDHWQSSAVDFPNHVIAARAMRHAQFQLVQAVGRDGATSISAKGQTGEGYEGHVFWDADLYVLPVFAYTRPDIARSMLIWRISGLNAARANARAMGQGRGALYPWRTIGGRECSSFFPAGSAQYHINADIAFALQTYCDATGDTTILDGGGAEMLVETARIWLEIGFHDPQRGGAFVINRVTGPDEYSAIVDNNLYTNMMAAAHLRFAARIGMSAGLLDAIERDRMVAAADAMLMPFDEDRAVFAQDEGFFAKEPWPFASTPAADYPLLLHHHPLKIYRHQVAKQADAVLAIALMPEQFAADARSRMVEIYEAVTVHDSTLSASAFASAAAHVGDRERASRYWRTSVLTDLCNLFGNSDHGLHMAALAGSWTTLAMGFAGMRVVNGQLRFDPIYLPDIGPYRFRTRFRGSLIEVSVTEANASYCSVAGEPFVLRHGKTALSVGHDPIVQPLSL